jgi:hypothetical protein
MRAPGALSSRPADEETSMLNIAELRALGGNGQAGPDDEPIEDEPLEPDDPLLNQRDAFEPFEIDEKEEGWPGDRIVR